MRTASRRSMRRRFSLLPPARALAPSLSVSSSRAEGSAIDSFLIKRRQQDKPLWGPPVVVRVPEGVAQVARRDELAVDEGGEGGGIFAMLDAVDLEGAFQ